MKEGKKEAPTVLVLDALRERVEKETNGHVTVLRDDRDNPSHMLVIPKFQCEEIDPALGTGTFPAFIVDGQEKSELFIGHCQAMVKSGRAYSLLDERPQYGIDFDDSRAACVAKGKGWHLTSGWDWAAAAYYVTKHGLQKYFDRSGWWEWVDGLKIVDGKLFFPNGNDYALPEADWPFQGACFDADGDDPVLSAEVTNFSEPIPKGAADDRDDDYAYVGSFERLELSDSYKKLDQTTRERMARMMIEPAAKSMFSEMSGSLFVRNYGERFPVRGGSWGIGAGAGLGALTLGNRRSYVSSCIGLRPAFLL